jgi:hypothetical protein
MRIDQGAILGLDVGVAVLPILASNVVTREAMELAESRPVRGFAAIAFPAIIELSSHGAGASAGGG